MNRSDILVMRITPFGESDLIFSGLSPEFGRLDFMMKGARKNGPKRYPAVGLFRILNGEFRDPDSRGGLSGLRNVMPVENFDAVAVHTPNYLAACSMMKFLCSVCRPMLPAPMTFQAARVFLRNMSSGGDPVLGEILLRLVHASESGVLPEPAADRAVLQRELLLAGLGQGTVPELRKEYAVRILQWIRTF